MKSPKFIVFVDHYACFSKHDCFVALEGNTLLEAMKSFERKFNVFELQDKVYLFKMMQRKAHTTNNYEDILVNRGHGWNSETSETSSVETYVSSNCEVHTVEISTLVYDHEIKNIEKYKETY